MSAARQAAALLALIDAWRARECTTLGDMAAQETRRLRRDAQAAARRQVQAAIREARMQIAHARQVQQAEQAQQQSRQQLQTEQQLLAAGMDLLRQQLLARWQQQNTRAQWVQMALHQAQGVLPPEGWQIDHPAGWPTPEQDAWAQAAQAQGQGRPCFSARPQLTAGLRICASGACLDATIDGLLRDQALIQAHLLALLRDSAHE